MLWGLEAHWFGDRKPMLFGQEAQWFGGRRPMLWGLEAHCFGGSKPMAWEGRRAARGTSLSVTDLSSLNLRDSLALRPRTHWQRASFVASLDSSVWGGSVPLLPAQPTQMEWMRRQ